MNSAPSHTPPTSAQIIKRLVRLNLARQDFIGSRALAENLITNPVDPRNMLFRPLIAGIIITYARPFCGNEGIGPLDQSFEKFDDPLMHQMHKKMLQLRDKMYAHRDALDTIAFTRHPSINTELYQLQVRFDEFGNFACCSNAPELNPEHLPNIVKLCDVQSRKANTAVIKLMPHLTKGRRFAAGTYTIEEICSESDASQQSN